ncbi:MAG TPA: glutathione S-transferase family protein [Chromatiaceae bacterium]|nr:glutathione S-transferase family protein [Chromatiaceae bacterium]
MTDRVVLHQFRAFWGLPNASPYCMKVETYLRWARIDYRIEICDPRRSPSGQIPFITVGSETITDSQRIIEYFESQRGGSLDQSLSKDRRSEAWFVRTRVEEVLYWQITYMRWGDPQGWACFLPDLKQYLSGWKRAVLPYMIRIQLLRQMRRHDLTPRDVTGSYASGVRVLDQLSHYLADKPFFMGEQIRSLDMSLYAFLANIIDQPHTNRLQEHARTLDNLMAYCTRMKQDIWSDWVAPTRS